jgi:nucleoside-diphosphate-sugar epimerase
MTEIKKVLVTGASGFIGRALCVKILAEGWQVRGTFRPESDVSRLPGGVETFSIGSIDSGTKWDDALTGIDTVVHLAARSALQWRLRMTGLNVLFLLALLK